MPSMTPFSVAFDLQRVLYSILAFLVWSLLMFCSGYAYKWHVDSLADAKVDVKQVTVAATTAAAAATIDDQALGRLKTQLGAATARAATLQQILKDQSNATPPAANCRLVDGLRDQINVDISTGSH
ncbi:MAG: hypothetical protein V4631_21150 [Pseudomonadota bacterium]